MGLKTEKTYAIGIDVGGTKIKAGLVDDRGDILSIEVISTCGEKGYGYVLTQLVDLVNLCISSAPFASEHIQGIGLALPGAVDDQKGLCLFCPNLGWNQLEISRALTEKTGLPVRLINDANAACLSEYYFGGGQGTQNFLSITLGTGVGSGLILNGQLFTGRSGSGVEAGHMVLKPGGFPCTCGSKGCWETLVSASGIVRRTLQKMTKKSTNKSSSVKYSSEKDSHEKEQALTTESIFQAFREGDLLAQEIVEETRFYLALGLSNLINLFNPEKVSLGGGVAEAEEMMGSELLDQVNAHIFPTLKGRVEIYKARQGYYGGMVGAASLWLRQISII